jgi:membrane protease subunit HflC
MRRPWLGIVLIVLLLVALVAGQVLFVVDETKQAIILQFGEPVATVQNPGLAVKMPFIQNVLYFEKRILSSDAPPQEYLTADKKRLVVDHVTRWRIIDPLRFFETMRSEARARARLDDVVFSELRRELAIVEFVDAISSERDSLEIRVAQSTAVAMAGFGIDVVDVRTKRADLPTDVERNVFERMQAERQRESSLFRAEGEEQANIIRAQADRSSTIILAEGQQEAQKLRGEGEAQAIRIYAEALEQDPEFYAFSRRLEAYASVLKSGDKLVIPATSEFFRFLIDNGLASEEASLE